MTRIEAPLKPSPQPESQFGPAINLILEFTSPGGCSQQTRAARRISLDGKGGLIIYGDAGHSDRLLLKGITDLRIEPARPLAPTHLTKMLKADRRFFIQTAASTTS
jgi:hypothetical protein